MTSRVNMHDFSYRHDFYHFTCRRHCHVDMACPVTVMLTCMTSHVDKHVSTPYINSTLVNIKPAKFKILW